MLLLYIWLALCESVFGCSDLKPVQNFDFSNFARGKWYEIARYNTFDLEKNADCISYTFDVNRDGYVDIREVYKHNVTIIKAQALKTAEPGKLIFHVKESATPNVNVIVLATNNKDYVMFFNCVQDFAWIASRNHRIDPELKAEIHKYINETQILDASKIVWDDITSKECFDENL